MKDKIKLFYINLFSSKLKNVKQGEMIFYSKMAKDEFIKNIMHMKRI